jgi:hypothetical protein
MLAGRRTTINKTDSDKGEEEEGRIQIYSIERAAAQVIIGLAGAFATVSLDPHTGSSTLPPPTPTPTTTTTTTSTLLFSFVDHNKKVFVLAVNRQAGEFARKSFVLDLPPEASSSDSPVGLEIDSSSRLLYIVTRLGYVLLYNLVEGTFLARTHASLSNHQDKELPRPLPLPLSLPLPPAPPPTPPPQPNPTPSQPHPTLPNSNWTTNLTGDHGSQQRYSGPRGQYLTRLESGS